MQRTGGGGKLIQDCANARRIAEDLVRDKLRAASVTHGDKGNQETEGKDLLSVLARSYYSEVPSSRMSEDEVLSRECSLHAAGDLG